MNNPRTDLQPGTVVRWRTRQRLGLGQLEHLEPDGTAIVRGWLPCRSHTIRTRADQLTPLPELHAHVDAAARTAALLAEGIR